MPIFNIHQAKANFSNLLKLAERGEDVFIARGKRVVARLDPVGCKPARRKLDILRGKFKVPRSFFEPLPGTELDIWGQ